jgi:hypothetical protein
MKQTGGVYASGLNLRESVQIFDKGLVAGVTKEGARKRTKKRNQHRTR